MVFVDPILDALGVITIQVGGAVAKIDELALAVSDIKTELTAIEVALGNEIIAIQAALANAGTSDAALDPVILDLQGILTRLTDVHTRIEGIVP